MKLPEIDSCAKDPFLNMLRDADQQKYFGRHGTNQMFSDHRRIDTAHELLNKYLSTNTEIALADFACGVGTVGLKLAEQGYTVDFLDNEEKYFDYIKLKHTEGKIQFTKADISSYIGEKKYFAIFLGEAIEHMAKPDETLKALRDNLLPGGILCLTTPNGNYVDCQEPNWEEVKDQHERNEKLANNIGNHVCEFHPKELSSLVKEAGFVIAEHKLVISKQISESSLLRRLLPRKILWALDNKWAASTNSQGKTYGKIQIIVAMRAH